MDLNNEVKFFRQEAARLQAEMNQNRMRMLQNEKNAKNEKLLASVASFASKFECSRGAQVKGYTWAPVSDKHGNDIVAPIIDELIPSGTRLTQRKQNTWLGARRWL